MELRGTTCMVTGATGGIGAALARALHAADATVVVTDRDGPALGELAAELNSARPASAFAVAADQSSPDDVVRSIREAHRIAGPIELYWANAGVAVGTDLDTPDEVWDTALAVNVQAHYLAARELVPGWLERGHGYFCSTASAAGLLSQIGSVTYSVTKHAAVAFAEWLSITYGDRGVRVSCLCPQGVNTAMLTADVVGTGAAAVRAGGAVLEPADVASVCVDAVRDERFLILPHPEVLTYWQRKAGDVDRWLGGMRRLQSRLAAD